MSNTSPISNLLIVGQFELIQRIYQQVVIPPTVDREVRALQNFGVDLAVYTSATWLSVQMLTDVSLVNSLKNELDDGEAESIALALQLKADRLLIDELSSPSSPHAVIGYLVRACPKNRPRISLNAQAWQYLADFVKREFAFPCRC